MPDGCHGPQQLKDGIAQIRVHHAVEKFIEAIREDYVYLLASSYHNSSLCSFLKTPARGSYNTCHFESSHFGYDCMAMLLQLHTKRLQKVEAVYSMEIRARMLYKISIFSASMPRAEWITALIKFHLS
ncbi:predicted protein [Sclerotinia sclerotiorum 1980 UF-70]|uniref:Uncharacterized protein n=1 Tax=Sclerotinia sclerotiorum (strain ATCC 18683 / 1980 / Ss-1) TaxID=665079 RepID=A7F7X8_SCLS1|nr:predicted protein [Sclerotinia sclerotiorum 1980 UF-70]EDN98849.1 predicted protein [Sclerotinia sclerotiorum 1980 UF-70]